ncbi:U3 small nucleolar RNA-associated protein 14 homolog A-like [Stegodyphus dumicola]|uniref:U3 small nucleolar RNA-associated protein 14 homolog A-like n=1 Tax=Stegodyphus dumicola TaxID=202533 RepID=UPI0015B1D00E|nr:U3 small nucleolar RNA-associated protein 14 homolog A-like [Stegodyphus dumicola]
MPDTLPSVNPVPVFQTTASSSVNHIEEDSPLIEKQKPKVLQKLKKTSEPKKTTVEDEKEFSSEAHCLDSMVPDDITFGDEDLDDVPDGAVSIQQAFADEELIAEFKEEKKAAEKANRPEGIDLFLPGWGSWGGPGIKPSKRKRQRFFIKASEPPPKKNTLGNVIINEDKDKKAAGHQVSNLPFPFSNIHQFESYIRQPIGHTWNPQSSFQNLVAPKVVTKSGKIIDPIDVEDVVLEKRTKQPAVKKFKKKVHEIKAF